MLDALCVTYGSQANDIKAGRNESRVNPILEYLFLLSTTALETYLACPRLGHLLNGRQYFSLIYPWVRLSLKMHFNIWNPRSGKERLNMTKHTIIRLWKSLISTRWKFCKEAPGT